MHIPIKQIGTRLTRPTKQTQLQLRQETLNTKSNYRIFDSIVNDKHNYSDSKDAHLQYV